MGPYSLLVSVVVVVVVAESADDYCVCETLHQQSTHCCLSLLLLIKL
jgi:hypothetical protein